MTIKGYIGAIIELLLFAFISYLVRYKFNNMNPVIYYWFSFSTLTGIWEYIYVTKYYSVATYADTLIELHKHVWTESYPITILLPWEFSKVFYAEYAAYADREYMSRMEGDYWSRLIESSHAILCAFFSFLALYFHYNGYYNHSMAAGCVGMGQQLMNSILYLGEYFLQCRDIYSINYNSTMFPLGKMMEDRLFMWVNLFWLILPTYCIIYYLTRSYPNYSLIV